MGVGLLITRGILPVGNWSVGHDIIDIELIKGNVLVIDVVIVRELLLVKRIL